MTIVTQQTLGALALVSPAMAGQELAINANALDLVFDAPGTVSYLEASYGDARIGSGDYVVISGKRRFTLNVTNLAPSMLKTQVLIVGKDFFPSPIITEFVATKTGTIITLTASFTNGTGYISGVGAFASGDAINVSPTKATTYVLTVTNASNNVASATITVYPNQTFSSTTYTPFDDSTITGHVTPTYAFNLIYTPVSTAMLNINAPSGVKSYKGLNRAKIEWVLPDVAGFLGVRVQYSVDSTGINVPYVQYGGLVTNISRTENGVMFVDETKSVTDSTTTTTTTEETFVVNYSSVSFPSSLVSNSNVFYVVLSTVVQDPATNNIYESSFNGPYKCGFVDLRQVSPADFPYLQQKEDIASRLIVSATKNYPDLDLTPRSEIRDLHIDPISIELSNQSVREWFARCSQSISAMAQIDDYNGDGFSDDITESPFKAQIARAWNMSAQNAQMLIDRQFDILGESRAGLIRGPATTAVALVTLYTYTKPTAPVTLSGIIAGSTGDGGSVPSLNYYSRAVISVDPQSADSIYDPVNGWWSVSMPFECGISGSIGNVGAGTITQGVSGLPNGWFCVNQDPAQYGTDRESNSKFAERIKNRMVVGVDTGRRLGYLEAARSTAGVVDANVVASGDEMMVRDWFVSPTSDGGGKHLFGTVDVYVRGSSYAQQSERKAFVWGHNSTNYRVPSSYASLSIKDMAKYSLKIDTALPYPVYAIVELVLVRGTGEEIYLGTDLTKIDATNNVLYLNGREYCTKLTGDAVSEAYSQFKLLSTDSYDATNISVLNALASEIASGSTRIRGLFRLRNPLVHVPSYQPVTAAFSIVGNDTQSSAVHLNNIRLIKNQDPLLLGFSNRASDTIRVDANNITAVVSAPLFFTEPEGTIEIDSDMVVVYNQVGNFDKSSLNSVRSEDMYTLYEQGVDYNIVPLGRYNRFGIQRTATSRIPFHTDVVPNVSDNVLIGYNKYALHEYCTYTTEDVTLVGSTPSPLANAGFVANVWVPYTYGNTTLSADSGLIDALVPRQKRYIKVTKADGTVMVEGRDFNIMVVEGPNQAYVVRIPEGRIPDGTTVTVAYFYNEAFTISTQYPGHVEQTAYVIEQTRHAGADVLVKQMIENSVDVTLTVELNPNTTPEIMDGRIRTAIGMVLSNARTRVTQAEIIRQVQSLNGISNVKVPLSKFAKSDGSMNIGHVIPSGTSWSQIGTDPLMTTLPFPIRTYISTDKILEDNTIPSGGLVDSYVGLLYEGQSFYRATSMKDFIAKVAQYDKTGAAEGAFYIIGLDDSYDGENLFPNTYCGRVIIRTPQFLTTPTYGSYKVTYEVWREGGQKDITLSPTEYLKAGRITIDYV